MMKGLQERHKGRIHAASFDRGSYTPDNLEALRKLLDVACVPRKGRSRPEDVVFEDDAEYRRARRRHAGIESAINALVNGNGLDRCRDRGEDHFTRYVALAVLGRNLQTLGEIVLEKARKKAASRN